MRLTKMVTILEFYELVSLACSTTNTLICFENINYKTVPIDRLDYF